MGASYTSFEELECWRKARELKLFVQGIIQQLPSNEKFDLADNMRRAARTCTRNIAEGFGRFHYQENIQFCRISRGSMFEIWDDLITCRDEKYIDERVFNQGIALIQNSVKILNGYIKYLEKAKDKNVNEPESPYGISENEFE